MQAPEPRPASPSVQIVSQKDEHCWVGELNGLRGEPCPSPPSWFSMAFGDKGLKGHQLPSWPALCTGWFPAKFVEVLDERSKEVGGGQGGLSPPRLQLPQGHAAQAPWSCSIPSQGTTL